MSTNNYHYDYGEKSDHKFSDGLNKWLNESQERNRQRRKRIEEELSKPPVSKEQIAMERALERYFGRPSVIPNENGNIPDKYRGETDNSWMFPERKKSDPVNVHPMDEAFREGFKEYKESLKSGK